ncbi:uroporphyrinogen-III synthase [Jeongeupia naejangsanensis]|uniref:Uroporphyrinogen-III synthase n=1 Tax=Jeongeupia naejangsanensis TaxID=613195 RepID=A0ABS2BQE5_9NEIS|nr:uroporphyrinogen-III synthase [Jeongeupia naejangsanensis]MBM3117665.1 uroporphyrinogen-III synthase [Jeongeupia naejangsanensis]
MARPITGRPAIKQHRSAPPASLAGRRIWVTRPQAQAGTLATLIEAQGGIAVRQPLLDIIPPADPAPFATALAALDGFDLVVFVSPTALDLTFAQLGRDWPATVPVAVVGPGSAARALELGATTVISPPLQHDSEGLLREAAMHDLAGRRVLLVRGESGRDVLPEALAARGATLTMVSAYRRRPPDLDDAGLTRLLDAGIDAAVISSSEAAGVLFTLAGGAARERLQSLLYFAPHPRIVAALHAHGAARVETCATGDAGTVDSLCHYFADPQP